MSNYGTTRHHPAAAAPKDRGTDYHTTLFRRLSWEGTVPLEIRVDPNELPANSDRGLECYFMQAPRVSYLPLLMPEIRRFLMDVVFDEAAAKVLKEEDWWFECDDGTLLKWLALAIGLIYDNHSILATIRPGSSLSATMATPLRLILHLASPPTDKLLLSPSAESCKQAFMGQLKEADFIRWGNTKRITSLRKVDQDGLWEGIKEHNFDDYWRVASKSPGPPPSSVSMHGRPPSGDAAGPAERDGAYNVRSVPVRVYLPDGPVIQDLVPPILEDAPPPSRSNPHPQAPSVPEIAYPLIQGVVTPPESEMAWLGACLAGADGWLNICVGISKKS
ncbi:autophagy protein Apg5-domain-containing protein [Mycena leptocephala]|nr:autophagy protein Apg5-domain-containing protein [Mycena leptocephala]